MKTTKIKTAARRSTGGARGRTAAPRDSDVLELVPALLKLKSLLVPIDFSEESKKALRYAVPFAHQFGAKLTLLYVVEAVAFPDFAYYPLAMGNDKAVKAAEGELKVLCAKEKIDPALIEKTLIRVGKSYEEIVGAARGLKVDLIIIATHGYGGMKHLLLGSTAERVVRHAPCPVLVVREREHELV